MRRWRQCPLLSGVWSSRRLSSNTLHALASTFKRFRCGRPRTANYVYVKPRGETSSPCPFCLVCQRAQEARQEAACFDLPIMHVKGYAAAMHGRNP